ncbi:MAG: LuxR C-terminal-related transcriptional regulator [Rhizonema sp. NSF051]|nr:LuxR C-terminal-related transcriptional regulator [Rhizonema sp. NSF051]
MEYLEVNITKRQLDVFKLIKDGMSNKQIGKQLNISDLTVAIHVAALLKKFEFKNRTQLMRLYLDNSNLFV